MTNMAAAYAGLADIDDTAPIDRSDAACLDEIRAVLMRHGMIDRFGVTLLHTHFPVHEGETLLEACNADSRTLTLQVVPEDAQAVSQSVGTSWRLQPDGDVLTSAICSTRCVIRNGQHDRNVHVKVAG